MLERDNEARKEENQRLLCLNLKTMKKKRILFLCFGFIANGLALFFGLRVVAALFPPSRWGSFFGGPFDGFADYYLAIGIPLFLLLGLCAPVLLVLWAIISNKTDGEAQDAKKSEDYRQLYVVFAASIAFAAGCFGLWAGENFTVIGRHDGNWMVVLLLKTSQAGAMSFLLTAASATILLFACPFLTSKRKRLLLLPVFSLCFSLGSAVAIGSVAYAGGDAPTTTLFSLISSLAFGMLFGLLLSSEGDRSEYLAKLGSKIAISLREARKKAGLSQEALAEAVHLDRTTISKYENGSIEPSKENIELLEKTLGPLGLNEAKANNGPQ